MFSLCIPTMDRFDNFLSINLPKYIENPLINEIIISDENGNDVEKIKVMFPNNNKLKLFVNDKQLGPFLNKIKVCQKAKNEWIALIDSDNFANEEYFKKVKEFITNHNIKKNSVISPDYGTEVFQWGHLSKMKNDHGILSKKTYKKMVDLEKQNPKMGKISHILNTGNYILNKYLIDKVDLKSEMELIKISHCFDVVLMNLLFFEQLNLKFYIVKDLKYNHSISDDSIYIRTIQKLRPWKDMTYKRIWKYLSN